MPKNPVVEPKNKPVKKKQERSSNKRAKPDLIEYDRFPQMKQPTFVRKDIYTGLNIPVFIWSRAYECLTQPFLSTSWIIETKNALNNWNLFLNNLFVSNLKIKIGKRKKETTQGWIYKIETNELYNWNKKSIE